jgi:hypothetical protein
VELATLAVWHEIPPRCGHKSRPPAHGAVALIGCTIRLARRPKESGWQRNGRLHDDLAEHQRGAVVLLVRLLLAGAAIHGRRRCCWVWWGLGCACSSSESSWPPPEPLILGPTRSRRTATVLAATSLDTCQIPPPIAPRPGPSRSSRASTDSGIRTGASSTSARPRACAAG